jgi:hypothetical protein
LDQPTRYGIAVKKAQIFGDVYGSPTVDVSGQGLKPQSFFAALIGPAKAVPLLQGLDRDAATPILLWCSES